MQHRTKDIARSFWRFFEILLFFAVSVVGFGLLVKAAPSASKGKEKQASCSRMLADAPHEAVASLLFHPDAAKAQPTADAAPPAFVTSWHRHCATRLPLPVHEAPLLPGALFQESAVLLI